MSNFGAGLALAMLTVSLSSCADMTLSHEAAVDYDSYRVASVSVEPNYHTSYFTGELVQYSGFQTITTQPGPADLYIHVQVSSTRSWTASSDDDDSVFDCNYDASARFEARDSAGVVVDSGETEDCAASPDTAEEYALDEIVLHYHKPFRI